MSATVSPGHFVLDPSGSTVTIHQRTMWGLVNVGGTFASVSGTGEVNSDGSATGSVVLDAGSLDTGHAKRDAHLRSADFFAVEAFPTLTFEATDARIGAGDRLAVQGKLTVRDRTRPLPLTATVSRTESAGVTLTTQFSLDRADFGLTWNQMGMVRGPVSVSATLRFTPAAA
ncbi:YceI family protein [Streptomyces sp. NPDC001443]